MNDEIQPAIARLVKHHDGPSALSRKLGNHPVYQEISRWVARGWASPAHIFRLEPFLPEGMSVRDLHNDREVARAKASLQMPVPLAQPTAEARHGQA